MASVRRDHFFFVALFALFVAAFLFARPHTDDYAALAQSCTDTGSGKQVCYHDLVQGIAKKDGIAAGFDMLAVLYEHDQEFASYCHGTTHELGKIAYESFRASKDFSVSTKTSYCGFGFYHGFMEAMLHDTGDVARAKEFCDYVDSGLKGTINGVSFACYHGIGHGTVDGTDTALWGDERAFIMPGLTMCASLPTDVEEQKTRCASGVFNALAIAYLNPKYEFSPNPDDPYRMCRTDLRPYERKACYDQMNGYVNKSSPDFQTALQKALATSESTYRELAVDTTAGYRALEAVRGSRPLGEYIEDCAVLPSAYQELCVHGFASSLIEQGKPGEEYRAAVAMCLGAGRMRDVCLRGVYVSVYDRLPPDLRARLCVDVGESLGSGERARCEAIMQKS